MSVELKELLQRHEVSPVVIGYLATTRLLVTSLGLATIAESRDQLNDRVIQNTSERGSRISLAKLTAAWREAKHATARHGTPATY
jgi:hypothetical protein